MTLDQVFGLVLIALGGVLIVIVIRGEKLHLGPGLVEALVRRLPRRGQQGYTIALAIFVIVLGVIALVTRG